MSRILTSDALVAIAKNLQKIPFDQEWCNGTGYYDHAVDAEIPLADAKEFHAFVSYDGILPIIIVPCVDDKDRTHNVVFFPRGSNRVCINTAFPIAAGEHTAAGFYPFGRPISSGSTLTVGDSYRDEELNPNLVKIIDDLFTKAGL